MNRPDLARPTRRPHRLPGRDYTSAGTYFVTSVTFGRECILGVVQDGSIVLSQFGEVVHAEWLRTTTLRPGVQLDSFIVMPNHLHALITFVASTNLETNLADNREANIIRAPRSLGALVAGFKSTVTKQINLVRETPGHPVWQRNYYDHIVRNDADRERIRAYIRDNPQHWQADPENPATSQSGPTM